MFRRKFSISENYENVKATEASLMKTDMSG
jgi:hypothetical protein